MIVLASINPSIVPTPKPGSFAMFLNASDGDKLYKKDSNGSLSLVGGGGGDDKVGDLTALNTTNQTDAVSAINEIWEQTNKKIVKYNGTYYLTYDTMDLAVADATSGDSYYIRSGTYTVSTNMAINNVKWVFDPCGGQLTATSGSIANDNGNPINVEFNGENWTFVATSAIVFQFTGDSRLKLRYFVMSSPVVAFLVSAPTEDNYYDIVGGDCYGGSYGTSIRANANGNFQLGKIYNAGYGMFIREQAGVPVKGKIKLSFSASNDNSTTLPLYMLGGDTDYSADIDVNLTADDSGTGGSMVIISCIGRISLTGEILAKNNNGVYVNSCSEFIGKARINSTFVDGSCYHFDSIDGSAVVDLNEPLRISAGAVGIIANPNLGRVNILKCVCIGDGVISSPALQYAPADPTKPVIVHQMLCIDSNVHATGAIAGQEDLIVLGYLASTDAGTGDTNPPNYLLNTTAVFVDPNLSY